MKLTNGILGKGQGKVGNVIGANWKNVNYVRAYAKPANPNTQLQQNQRTLMTNIVRIGKLLVGGVFNPFSDKFVKGMSGFNKFVKDNIMSPGNPTDLTQFVYTEGKLFKAEIDDAEFATGNVTIGFSDSIGSNGAATDLIQAFVLCDPITRAWFAAAPVQRSEAEIVVPVPGMLGVTETVAVIFATKYVNSVLTMISDSSVVAVTT
jgi:hypothetical protein